MMVYLDKLIAWLASFGLAANTIQIILVVGGLVALYLLRKVAKPVVKVAILALVVVAVVTYFPSLLNQLGLADFAEVVKNVTT